MSGPSACGRRSQRASGFTLFELFVVLAIAGVLAAIATTSYRGFMDSRKGRFAISDIRMLELDIGRYQSEFGGPPPSLAAIGRDSQLDPWSNPYDYLRIAGEGNSIRGRVRKDKFLVPLNTDYDLYSRGPDGESRAPLTARHSRDDIVRAANGAFVGVAVDY